MNGGEDWGYAFPLLVDLQKHNFLRCSHCREKVPSSCHS